MVCNEGPRLLPPRPRPSPRALGDPEPLTSSRFRVTSRMVVLVTWSALLSTWAPFSARADSTQARSKPYVGQRYVSLSPQSMAQVEAIWTRASAVLAPHDPALVEHRV